MGYISLDKFDVDAIYGLLLQKLGPPNHEQQLSHLREADVILARDVIRVCFRRAIYTRMDSERG